MNESVIIQKLIQVGQMLQHGELEYSSAEADIKYYLEQYAALRQPLVLEQKCVVPNCKNGPIEGAFHGLCSQHIWPNG